MTEDFLVFLSASRKILRWYLKSDRGYFILSSSPFTLLSFDVV
jgi:hypothetical protein